MADKHDSGIVSFTSSWLFDSGANAHIVDDLSLFTTIATDKIATTVQIPKGTHVAVRAVGTVRLSDSFVLHDVLGVPEFAFNLISVSRLVRDLKCVLTFGPDFCLVQEIPSRKLIRVGRQHDGLYQLLQHSAGRSFAAIKCNDSIWHNRMGHLPISKFRFLPSVIVFAKEVFCDACNRAKQTRLSFPLSTSTTVKAFDLIHCDIWGPYKTPSLSGAHYFLTIVDDYSRTTWVYLMKSKSETSRYLLHFLKWVRTQFNTTVKRVRSDNGLEFSHAILLSYYANNGIEVQTSCVYTPQQNGVTERKHRHILEVARALRFHASLPLMFWGECILTAVYLINRMPITFLHNKTPYELLMGVVPVYSHLRVFDCLCYGYTYHGSRDKFAPRSTPGVFLGYPHSQKGYKIFDLSSRKVYVSRDVSFYKTVFPFTVKSSLGAPSSTAAGFPFLSWDPAVHQVQLRPCRLRLLRPCLLPLQPKPCCPRLRTFRPQLIRPQLHLSLLRVSLFHCIRRAVCVLIGYLVV